MESKDFIFKIALLGNSGVGKTSLINQYVSKKFKIDYRPTLGASIVAKDIKFSSEEEITYNIRLVIWDLAGQDKYETTRQMYFQGAVGAILVYDVTREQTFNGIEDKWIPDFKDYASKDASFLLIGNKTDLNIIRKVDFLKGQQLSEKIGASSFIETSAKTGDNVEKCFTTLVKEILILVKTKNNLSF